MKYLVIVRHGQYVGEDLTSIGREQIESLSTKLAERLCGYSIALISSTAERAIKTSEILADQFGGIEFEKHSSLRSGGNEFRDGQEQDVLEMIEAQANQFDAIVLSTHREFIDFFPRIWGRKNGFDLRVASQGLKGSARLITVDTGKEELIMPF